MLIHAVTSMYRSCHEHESLLLVPKFFVWQYLGYSLTIWTKHMQLSDQMNNGLLTNSLLNKKMEMFFVIHVLLGLYHQLLYVVMNGECETVLSILFISS